MANSLTQSLKTRAAGTQNPVLRFALKPVRAAYRAARWAKYCMNGTCDRRIQQLDELAILVRQQQRQLSAIQETISGGHSLQDAGQPLQSQAQQSATPSFAGFEQPYKLHIGCYANYFEGWVNLDLEAGTNRVDIEWDLDRGLPAPDNSCRFIHSEHVIEHLPVEVGVRYFKECYRALAPGGVVRTAMPSLDNLLEKSVNGDWRDQDWLTWPEYQCIATRAEMLNIAFRSWDHQWLYDREELHRRLKEAGFTQIADCENQESQHPELRGLETRKDSILICEATKP